MKTILTFLTALLFPLAAFGQGIKVGPLTTNTPSASTNVVRRIVGENDAGTTLAISNITAVGTVTTAELNVSGGLGLGGGAFDQTLLNPDGSGSFAAGNITWDAAGNLNATSYTGNGSGIAGAGSLADVATNLTTGLPVFNSQTVMVLDGAGDSIIAAGTFGTSNQLGADSFMTWVNYESGGMVHYHRDVGAIGAKVENLTSQLYGIPVQGRGPLAMNQYEPRASHVAIYIGANEIMTPTNFPLAFTNLSTMVFDCKQQGYTPILFGVAPVLDANNAPMTTRWNTEIKKLGQVFQCPVVDFWSVAADPTTNLWRAGYTLDGIHPNQRGAQLLGRAFLQQMGIVPTINYQSPWLAKDRFETNNIGVTNGVFTDLDGNGTPEGWTLNGANGETLTLVTNSEIRGNWAMITKGTATGIVTLTNSQTYSCAAGDELVIAGRIWATNLNASGGGGLCVLLRSNNSPHFLAPVFMLTNDVPKQGVFSATFLAPQGFTNAYLEISMTNMTGSPMFGQIKAVNVTRDLTVYNNRRWYPPGTSTNNLNVNVVDNTVGIGAPAPSAGTANQPRLKIQSAGAGKKPVMEILNTDSTGFSAYQFRKDNGGGGGYIGIANSGIATFGGNSIWLAEPDQKKTIGTFNDITIVEHIGIAVDGQVTLSTNLIVGAVLSLATNGYSAASFTPVAGQVRFAASNYAIYTITVLKTNQIVADGP